MDLLFITEDAQMTNYLALSETDYTFEYVSHFGEALEKINGTNISHVICDYEVGDQELIYWMHQFQPWLDRLNVYVRFTRANYDTMGYSALLSSGVVGMFLERPTSQIFKQTLQLASGELTVSHKKYGKITLTRRAIAACDKMSRLTQKEADLLKLLMRANGTQVTVATLLTKTGYGPSAITHTIETHMYRLRKKFKDDFGIEDFVENATRSYYLNLG